MYVVIVPIISITLCVYGGRGTMHREIDFANVLLSVHTWDWTKTKFSNDTVKYNIQNAHARKKHLKSIDILLLFIISRNQLAGSGYLPKFRRILRHTKYIIINLYVCVVPEPKNSNSTYRWAN